MVASILLAAGTSSRMGADNKLLLPFEGNPLIRQVAEQLLHAPVMEVILVLGHEEKEVRNALEGLPVRFVVNPRYHLGMTSSIQAGIAALSPEASAFLVCLGDMPLLTAAHYEALIRFFEEKKKTLPAPVMRPSDGDRMGHPVLFDVAYIPDILTCQDKEGCRDVIRRHRDHFLLFPTREEAYFRDVDDREDYEILC